jgi:hypothetical protein
VITAVTALVGALSLPTPSEIAYDTARAVGSLLPAVPHVGNRAAFVVVVLHGTDVIGRLPLGEPSPSRTPLVHMSTHNTNRPEQPT